MRTYIYYLVLMAALNQNSITLATMQQKSCTDRELHQLCGSYTFRVVKSLLAHIRKVHEELEKYEEKIEEIKDLKEKFEQVKKAINNEIAVQGGTSEEKEENSWFLSPIESLLKKFISTDNCEVNELKKTKENSAPNSCIPVGQFSGVHEIEIPELGKIDVLCDSQTVGNEYGWLVIQQRIDDESFFKNWTEYRNGFGSYRKNFFIGLEKLYRLTKGQQMELYVYLKDFSDKIIYARYDNFKVGSEEEGYKLNSLGEYSSNNSKDCLRAQENQKFSTFDHDNDEGRSASCLFLHRAGWWYNNCEGSNLNDKMMDGEPGFVSGFWCEWKQFLEIKMLIRPKAK